ncbi:hypothetical protein B484DRAFT_174544 [Ochromonadaceae sp. CCMP2298]|nr:hypothetical protein B484DRAFT_174544 [Ochromonadaceae sp. CCMP2298]
MRRTWPPGFWVPPQTLVEYPLDPSRKVVVLPRFSAYFPTWELFCTLFALSLFSFVRAFLVWAKKTKDQKRHGNVFWFRPESHFLSVQRQPENCPIEPRRGRGQLPCLSHLKRQHAFEKLAGECPVLSSHCVTASTYSTYRSLVLPGVYSLVP